MKNILLRRKPAISFLSTFVITFIISTSSHVEQIGLPTTSIMVTQQSSAAADTDDCGTIFSTPTCRTIQHAVNRVAQGGTIIKIPQLTVT